jgi:hypothetical protein
MTVVLQAGEVTWTDVEYSDDKERYSPLPLDEDFEAEYPSFRPEVPSGEVRKEAGYTQGACAGSMAVLKRVIQSTGSDI